jgi:hypothetical protein
VPEPFGRRPDLHPRAVLPLLRLRAGTLACGVYARR